MTLKRKTVFVLGMTSTASATVADTIANQIGGRALFMIGAKNLLSTDRSLSFKVTRNAKGVTLICVTLTPADTYRVEFLKWRGYKAPVTLADREDVYADSLLAVIETETGLRTSL